MKKLVMILCASLLIAAFGLLGCGKSAPENTADTANAAEVQNGLKASDSAELVNKSFVLSGFDGKPYEGKVVPTMMFNGEMRIAGNFCNRFMGQAQYSGGVLLVEQMASTRMMCMDNYLNELENIIPQMLSNGADVDFDGQTLILRQGGHEAEYTLNR